MGRARALSIVVVGAFVGVQACLTLEFMTTGESQRAYRRLRLDPEPVSSFV